MATIEVKFVSRKPPASWYDIVRVSDGAKMQISELDSMTARGDAVIVLGKDGAKLWRPKTPGVATPARGFTDSDRDRVAKIENKLIEIDASLHHMMQAIDVIFQNFGLESPGASDEDSDHGND